MLAIGYELKGVKCHLWVGGFEDCLRSLCGFKLGRPRVVDEIKLELDVESWRGRRICKKCLRSYWCKG